TRQTTVTYERAEHLRGLWVGCVVGRVAGSVYRWRGRAGGERERLREQQVRTIVSALDEPGLDEPRERTTGRLRVETCRAHDVVQRRRAEHQCSEHLAAITIRQQAGERACVEHRLSTRARGPPGR